LSKQFGLPATVRLKHKKAIEQVYSRGTSLMQFPLLLKFYVAEPVNFEPVVAMFTVSKKKLSSAPARNRAKRQMREVFRMSAPVWRNWKLSSNKQLHLSLIYVHNELLPTAVIEKAWIQLLCQLEALLVSNCILEVKNST
jgi:ribonuclease P protein component